MTMQITLIINASDTYSMPNPARLSFLLFRRLGYFSVMFGDGPGHRFRYGSLDGRPINAGSLLAAEAQGHKHCHD